MRKQGEGRSALTNKKSLKWFIVALLVPVFILTTLLIKPVQTKMIGTEIQLATVPVDPRDLFYGDYVILDLEIELVELDLLDADLKEKVTNTYYGVTFPVYVSLEEGDAGIYEVISVSETKPEGLFIKGKLTPYVYDDSQWNPNVPKKPYVMISYGMDRFYVEEGTGLELERLSSQGKVIVTAKVYNGYYVLTDIRGIEE